MIEEKNFMNERELAGLLQMQVSTLQRWRWEGRGPKHYKFGASVRYALVDVTEFITTSQRSSTGSTMTKTEQSREKKLYEAS